MSHTEQIRTIVDNVFDEYEMNGDGDQDTVRMVNEFKGKLTDQLTALFNSAKPAGRRKRINVSGKKNNADGQPKAKRSGNYYSKFYSFVCKMSKDIKENGDDGTLDFALEGESVFGFTEPSGKLTKSQEESLEKLKGVDSLQEFQTNSLRELFNTLRGEFEKETEVKLTAMIWKFYMGEEDHQAFKAHIEADAAVSE